MYNETNVPGPEYRVRAVTRHVVTKYFHPYQSQDGSHGSTGSSQVIGEFDNAETAVMVAYALAGTKEGSTVSL